MSEYYPEKRICVIAYFCSIVPRRAIGHIKYTTFVFIARHNLHKNYSSNKLFSIISAYNLDFFATFVLNFSLSSFKTANVPDLFFSEDKLGNLDISIGIKPRLLDDLHYIVELHACLTSKLEEEIVTILEITYSSFGRIIDENLNAEQINEILTDVIPENMYDPLRALVWEITSASGFTPIMMEDYNFMKNQVDLVETEIGNMSFENKDE